MQNINILLVEDNEVNQIVACALLRKNGISVAIANNGREALTLIQTKDFHLILMDLQMPEMDGYESTRHIRAFEDLYYKTIPIIAFSASSMITSRDRALAFGMTDFINKPFFVDELQEKIKRYVTEAKDQSEEKPMFTIDFDLHTQGDPAFKHELVYLLIDNILELKHAMQKVTAGNDPQLFLTAIRKVTPALDIIKYEDLNETIESLRSHYINKTTINLSEKLTLFYALCDYMIKVLNHEIVNCEASQDHTPL